MKFFIPDIAYINPRSLEYDVGKFAKEQLKKLNVPIIETKKVSIEGKSPYRVKNLL
ncbi:spore photoproduct lyase [Proteiniborus ethanoligenes]|jgi:spore photoproduct lyase|uniref:Spore photoproduct lyase n=1 Tax=Proteiniborus ethanoligenes TaxID=415015 RepID=A0A1H3SMJ1_9FIRM|nr:hypothetical protein [Proteiniborus ethanoligenes]SDZ38947.1 spore photoproduct lyase [Proteiniborus ethanoligenes]